MQCNKCKFCGKEFSNLLLGSTGSLKTFYFESPGRPWSKSWTGRLKTHEESCSKRIINEKEDNLEEAEERLTLTKTPAVFCKCK